VVAKYEDECGRKSIRKITHPIGSASQRRADLQAVHIGLATIVRSMRKACTVRVLCPKELYPILESGKLADEDADVLTEIVRWTTFYSDFKFTPCDEDTLLGRDLAKDCAESQSGTDTGTVVE